jgi:hypothetical protein
MRISQITRRDLVDAVAVEKVNWSVRGLGAPVASIGGAGTFDGIFLTGIMAVPLAGLKKRAKRWRPPSSRPGQAYLNSHNCRRTH